MTIKRKSPPRRVNTQRRKAEFVRVYGSKARVQWMQGRLCSAMLSRSCDEPVENAHTENGGMGRKGDASTIIPLCARHHRSLHQIGPDAFERAYGISLSTMARLTDEAWQKHVGAF